MPLVTTTISVVLLLFLMIRFKMNSFIALILMAFAARLI